MESISGKLYSPTTPDLVPTPAAGKAATLENTGTQSVGIAAVNKRRQLVTSLGTPATRHQLIDEGRYFVATNPTIGTGMTFITALTAFTDNSPAFYVENIDVGAGALGRDIYIDFLALITTAAATTTTQQHFAVRVDTGHRTVNTPANLAVITPAVPDSSFAVMSSVVGSQPITMPIVQVQNNAATPTYSASTANVRNVGRGSLGGLNIPGDQFTIAFGATDIGGYPALTAAQGAGQPGNRVVTTAPVRISPGNNCSIYLWGVGQAAAYNPEFVLGMWVD